MTALEHFQLIFPSHRLIVSEGELKYRFGKSEQFAKIYERIAQRIILKKGLPLTADAETWASGGVIFEVSLVVKPVPEEDLVEQL